MNLHASSVEDYVQKVNDNYKEAINKLRITIKANIPKGFEETLSYGMIGYVVPHSLFPAGYHCDPKLPLPFVALAAQKNFIAIYHMGIYAEPKLLEWFTNAHAQQVKSKLDMGKSCMRYKKTENIPYDLIGELMTKMTVDQWISTYKSAFKK